MEELNMDLDQLNNNKKDNQNNITTMRFLGKKNVKKFFKKTLEKNGDKNMKINKTNFIKQKMKYAKILNYQY